MAPSPTCATRRSITGSNLSTTHGVLGCELLSTCNRQERTIERGPDWWVRSLQCVCPLWTDAALRERVSRDIVARAR